MNTITGYATSINLIRMGAGEYSVIDTRINRHIGHVTVIRGFLHFTGTRNTGLEGVNAVIAPSVIEREDGTVRHCGGNHGETIRHELAKGIRGGRDDRK